MGSLIFKLLHLKFNLMGYKKIAIAGLPNVGKSTLFNRILGIRKALVHSLEGMTRDSIREIATWKGVNFEIIDTGGLWESDDKILKKVKDKAIEEALNSDLILFLLDSRRPITPYEEALFREIKSKGKEVLVVLNKVDSPKQDISISEYYRLGVDEAFPISAEHGLRIRELLDEIVRIIGESKTEKARNAIKLAIVGKANVGKSSIINRILGHERLIVSEIPGTTRDAVDSLVVRNKIPILLLDTAGIRKLSKIKDSREAASVLRSARVIREADTVCLVVDGTEGLGKTDVFIARLIIKSLKPMLIAINKWDLIQAKDIYSLQFDAVVKNRFPFLEFIPKIFVSAVTGKNVLRILDEAINLWSKAIHSIPESELESFRKEMEGTPIVSDKGRIIEIRRILHVPGVPPEFTLMTSFSEKLNKSWESWLRKKITERF
ncbi:MAG: ribosome biogenesis GTPase Der [Candidatus Aminicenantia bacterium]